MQRGIDSYFKKLNATNPSVKRRALSSDDEEQTKNEEKVQNGTNGAKKSRIEANNINSKPGKKNPSLSKLKANLPSPSTNLKPVDANEVFGGETFRIDKKKLNTSKKADAFGDVSFNENLLSVEVEMETEEIKPIKTIFKTPEKSVSKVEESVDSKSNKIKSPASSKGIRKSSRTPEKPKLDNTDVSKSKKIESPASSNGNRKSSRTPEKPKLEEAIDSKSNEINSVPSKRLRKSSKTPEKSKLENSINSKSNKIEIPNSEKCVKKETKTPEKSRLEENLNRKSLNKIKTPVSIKKERNKPSSPADVNTSKRKKSKSPGKHSKEDLETSVLSDEERHERKRMAAVLYQKFKNRQSVINHGCKEIPKGKPNCLAGLSFLVTGILESLDRDEANTMIKEFGGKCSTTVGKKLNYLVAGEEAGPKKLATAEELGIPIINEDELLNLIREKSELIENKVDNSISLNKDDYDKKKFEISPKKKKVIKKEINEDDNCGKIEENSLKKEEPEWQNDISPNSNTIKSESNSLENDEILAWVDKYKPSSLKEIIGQQGPASNCVKLTKWLTNWYTNHDGKKKLQKPNPWAKNDDGSFYKAALLSGPPGVGKTTTATLVSKELGFDLVEFNASDTRSKRLLKEEVSELLSNKSLHGYVNGKSRFVTKKHVLIMDEVDGMAGNEDRGGVQELINLIKESSVPVICMCNDRNHPKIRSLVNYCYDLRFNKPRLEQIKGRLLSICFKEKIKLSQIKLEEIITATNNDIRQSINHLSLLSAGKDLNLKSDGEQSTEKIATKNLKIGPWEVVRKVFSAEEHKRMTLNDKSDLFFHDYNLAPLFVQQNYLQVSPIGPKANILQKVALTADSLSLGDLVDKRIRSNSAWTLLPTQALFSSVLPGEYMEGHITGQINFPAWLGKYSKTNKRSRLAQEIHDHTRTRTSGSRLSIRLDYAPFLLASIVRPLIEKELDGVAESLNVLREYRLLRDDIESLIELSTWPGKKSMMDAVDSRVKTALTKTYNKEIMPYSYSVMTTSKKSVSNDADLLAEMDDNVEGSPASSDEENGEGLEKDAMIKIKKKPLVKKAAPKKEKKEPSSKAGSSKKIPKPKTKK